ncbi:hypothetical protein AB0878_16320 [Amycolatopsis sp. NPDC047767]|uniref:hypothetical protein n=1 Tax=Amycolatopsis sp. NPDC047767 TaxID=3156765 RepID=UPI00345713AA
MITKRLVAATLGLVAAGFFAVPAAEAAAAQPAPASASSTCALDKARLVNAQKAIDAAKAIGANAAVIAADNAAVTAARQAVSRDC